MKINSFFVKLFLSFTTIILCISAVFFTATNAYLKNVNKQIFIDQLTLNLNAAAAVLNPLIEQNNSDAVKQSVNYLGKAMQRRITLADINGTIIADSEKNADEMQNHLNRTEIKNAIAGKINYDIRYSSTLNQEMLYIASPITKNSEITGALRLSMPIKNINILSHKTSMRILSVILAAIAAAMLLSYFFTRRISRKVKKIKDAAEKMSLGNFNVRINAESDDELDKLAESFNVMSENTQQLFLQKKTQNDRLDKILSSIDDTIILIDKTGKVLTHNDSFKKHFKNINPDGKHYWEIFRSKEIENAVDGLLKNAGEPMAAQVQEYEKYFLFTARKVQLNDNIVLTFHNITAAKQMETIKRDFVANASHELKTPLTAINGFIETMETETDVDAIKHYAGIIKKHSLRLSRIVADLLSLSELENNKTLDAVTVQLDDIAENVIKSFAKKLTDKNLTCKLEKRNDEKYTVSGNEFYIEQMLVNLIENAVKYTEKGKITVKLTKENGKIILIVSDTGIGIPQEHLSRIFERFYVVDKARSRKTGGTGLGLSIVKYIAFQHNATVEVSSIAGKGTTFTIRF